MMTHMGVTLAKAEKKQVLAANIVVQRGHGVARLVREAEPETGITVEHQVIATDRVIDSLFEAKVIDSFQHQAATTLRNLYERAALSVGDMPSRDLGTPMGSGGERPLVGSDADWHRYIIASKQCGQWWTIIRLVVIDDGDAVRWGIQRRCDGYATLKVGLDRLVKHFGLDQRRKI